MRRGRFDPDRLQPKPKGFGRRGEAADRGAARGQAGENRECVESRVGTPERNEQIGNRGGPTITRRSLENDVIRAQNLHAAGAKCEAARGTRNDERIARDGVANRYERNDADK